MDAIIRTSSQQSYWRKAPFMFDKAARAGHNAEAERTRDQNLSRQHRSKRRSDQKTMFKFFLELLA